MSFFDREMRQCQQCGEPWQALTIWGADTLCTDCGQVNYKQQLAEINEGRTFVVDSIGGGCPTQADGRTSDDRPFYFRARHGEWALKLGNVGAPTCYVDWPDDGKTLVAEGDDPSGGFMDVDDVLAILDTHLGGPR